MVRIPTTAVAGSMVLLQSTATRSLAVRGGTAVLWSTQNRAISLRPTWLRHQHPQRRLHQHERGSKVTLSSASASPAGPDPEASAGDEDLTEVAQQLRDLLDAAGGSAVALTGAGMSTDSGIPDYRGPQGSYSRGHKPMTHDEFLSSESNRKRYWARSTFGWDSFSNARPNAAHVALAELEAAGKLSSVITQNVDGLQQKAGSQKVVDLHGRNDKVRTKGGVRLTFTSAIVGGQTRGTRWVNWWWKIEMLRAGTERRTAFTLEEEDPHLELTALCARPPPVHLRADGDADVEPGAYLGGFMVPDCDKCGGILKPTVVFFGDNIPRQRVEDTYRIVDESSLLIAAGSSLQVYSAFRLVKRAADAGKRLVVINLGDTRAERSGLDLLKASSPGVSSILPQLLF
ncbi:unnamed protein product [Scytosiphon promiscuus]